MKRESYATKIIVASILMFTSICIYAMSDPEPDTIINTVINEISAEEDTVNFAKFEAAEYDMLCLIAHFEGVKVRSYYDRFGRCWTIGIGNTVRPDGRKVGPTDKIKNEDELFAYFKSHIEKYIWPDMQKYLPISEMSTQEIAVIGSLLYNCGSGILRNKDGSPSYLADVIYSCYVYSASEDTVELIAEGDSVSYVVDSKKAYEYCKQELIKLMNQKIYAKGRKLDVLVKRRLMEQKIFFGEIIMDNKGEFALENSVNFAEQPLGATYGIPMSDFDDIVLVCDSINNCPYGRNLADSIEYAFNHPTPIKSASKKKVYRR